MRSPYSSVVERQSCKLKVRSSILRGGIYLFSIITATTNLLLQTVFNCCSVGQKIRFFFSFIPFHIFSLPASACSYKRTMYTANYSYTMLISNNKIANSQFSIIKLLVMKKEGEKKGKKRKAEMKMDHNQLVTYKKSLHEFQT